MAINRLFSIRFILLLIVSLCVIAFPTSSLYSQTVIGQQPSSPRSVTTNPSPPSQAPTNPSANPSANASQSLQALDEFGKRPSLLTQGAVLTLLSLSPFLLMILSSFLKIIVVLSLLRTALGVQQSPPNQIINGVALMLSLFIMYPTGLKMYEAAYAVVANSQTPESVTSPNSSAYIIQVTSAAVGPLKDFLKRNSSVRHQALFYRLAYRVLPDENKESLQPDDVMILVPSYITSQLKDAFEIGVLIYIPFFVIDLVTSNILLAMGMMMLSPVTISMPLKLFLLVMLDGWTLVIEGLVNTFR
ncbi:Flagellar biosynthetic protein FliP precursor [Candidatus Rubidus massiliensis]|nr:Flagellar biosynthetic protein FliP precursor [Candidatus Rubidus massiliensis]